MNRKHYRCIAEVFKKYRPNDEFSEAGALWFNLRREIAEVLKDENKAFDEHRFMAATEG